MQDVLTSTKGHAEYRHTNGEISKVRIEAVYLGMMKVRIATLPPVVHKMTLRIAVRDFGEIQGEPCCSADRYPGLTDMETKCRALQLYVEHPQRIVAPRAFRTTVHETLGTIQLATNKPRD
jgi:hypothetical protein